MAYQLHYHPAVLATDIPRITLDIRNRIQRAIQQRLTTEPSYYGEPMRHQLKGYCRLRVSDYRIIYRIEGQHVWILAIGHRRHIYDAIPFQRLAWRP